MFDGIEEEYVVALPQVAPPIDPVLAELLRVREWLSDPKRWIKGACYDGSARCLIGAVFEAVTGFIHDIPAELQTPARKAALEMLGGFRAAWNFNDTHSHSEVLAYVDRAIAARKAQA